MAQKDKFYPPDLWQMQQRLLHPLYISSKLTWQICRNIFRCQAASTNLSLGKYDERYLNF